METSQREVFSWKYFSSELEQTNFQNPVLFRIEQKVFNVIPVVEQKNFITDKWTKVHVRNTTNKDTQSPKNVGKGEMDKEKNRGVELLYNNFCEILYNEKKSFEEIEKFYEEFVKKLEINFVCDEENETKSEENNSVLTRKKFNKIFGELNLIKTITGNFYRDLQKIEKIQKKKFVKYPNYEVKMKELFHLFSNSGKVFIMFLSYSQNYDVALKVLKIEIKENEKFQKYLEDNKMNFSILDDMLIKPIQKIPRYQLILKTIYKNIKKYKIFQNNEEIEKKLEKTISLIDQIALKMNQKRNELSRMEKYMEISKLFRENFKFALTDNPKRKYVFHMKNVNIVDTSFRIKQSPKSWKVLFVDIYFFSESIFLVLNLRIIAKKKERIHKHFMPIVFNTKDERKVILVIHHQTLKLKIIKEKKKKGLKLSLKKLVEKQGGVKRNVILDCLLTNECTLEDKGFCELGDAIRNYFVIKDSRKFVLIYDENEHSNLRNMYDE